MVYFATVFKILLVAAAGDALVKLRGTGSIDNSLLRHALGTCSHASLQFGARVALARIALLRAAVGGHVGAIGG